VAVIRGDLPQDIDEPVVARYDPNSAPIISLTVSGRRPLKEITTFTKDEIKKRLESIPGVGSVTLVGGFEREINVYLDIAKMESYEISIDKVKMALQAANLEIPAGRIDENKVEYLVRTMGRVESVEQFNEIAIDNPQGQPVYLKDIAEVVDGIEEQRSLARVDGQPAVTLNISRQSGSNTVEIAEAIKTEIRKYEVELPPDIKISTIVDNSQFIEDSIHEILTNIIFGGLLAIFVIFLFLADIRSTLVSAVAIPTSIIATFTFMKMLGFTLNSMSLMGLSLAVGLLIDDAIVVIENIFRHLDEGKPAMKAAFEATKEIGLAVMATTFSIVVVFLPVAFMGGIVGRFFYQFGMTVAFAVTISLFVAFTLTPMLSSRFLKKESAVLKPPRFYLARVVWEFYRFILKVISPWNKFFDRVNVWYSAILGWSLRFRWLVVIISIFVFIGSLYAGGFVGSEFMPQTDQGEIRIGIETPPGTNLEETSARFKEVENIVKQLGETELIFTTIGAGQDPVNIGRIYIRLINRDLREISALLLVDSVRQLISVVPGIEFSVTAGESEGPGGKPVEISVRGNDLEIIKDLTHQVEEIFLTTPGTVDISNNLEEGKPELRIELDRGKANDLALNVYSIASSIRSYIDGDVVTRYKEGDEEYDVRVRLKETERSNAEDVGQLLIASNKEIEGRRTFLVPLSHVANIEKTSAIGKYNRYDRLREGKVGSNVRVDAFAGDVTNEILEKTKEMDVPPGYSIGVVGTGEIMEESFQNIFISLFLAVIFIYLLLASQFESFFDPFSIMISLPLSLIGAILALLVSNSSMSIISMIGIILLMGLVTKNAILLIDFIKQKRHQGHNRTEAIKIAGPIRLRPILMTTFAMIFGMLPLALALGPGAEFRAPMARAVIGGLISSTLLTLIVVPVIYTIIDDIIAFFLGRETIQPETEEIENAESLG